jgi:hypothetical protein
MGQPGLWREDESFVNFHRRFTRRQYLRDMTFREITSGNRSIAGKTLAALAVAAALAGASLAAARAPGPIVSGAGPGWPARLSPSDFADGVENRWFPLRPGDTWHYRGVKDGVRMVDTVRVTPRTKTILGVATRVVHDVVRVGGRPEEITDDFYAPDRHGNVYYFGEETRTLDRHGRTVSTEGSFEAGVGGARVGILVPGRPRVGMVGRQEFSKGEAEDHFRIVDLSARVSVPFISSRQALRTREWTPLEPGVIDNKFYVRGIGSVREVAVKGPLEVLNLICFQR